MNPTEFPPTSYLAQMLRQPNPWLYKTCSRYSHTANQCVCAATKITGTKPHYKVKHNHVIPLKEQQKHFHKFYHHDASTRIYAQPEAKVLTRPNVHQGPITGSMEHMPKTNNEQKLEQVVVNKKEAETML